MHLSAFRSRRKGSERAWPVPWGRPWDLVWSAWVTQKPSRRRQTTSIDWVKQIGQFKWALNEWEYEYTGPNKWSYLQSAVKPISLTVLEEVLPTGLNAVVMILSVETAGEADSTLSIGLPTSVTLFHMRLDIQSPLGREWIIGAKK